MLYLKVMAKIKQIVKKTKVKSKINSTEAVRDYNNTKRREKVDLNKQKIIQLYVEMLVKAAGEDVPLQMLAKKSKISLRTLFRFFGDKDSLNQEIENYMTQHFQTIGVRMQSMSFADYAAFTYQVFDEYEKLFIAYLATNFGQKSRQILRQKFYQLLMQKIEQELSLGSLGSMNSAQQMKLKIIIALINSQIWKDLRDSFQHTGAEMADAVKWAVQALLDDFKRS